jgi:alkylation response protein AidB-like acyl-CoA dehydrogenase
MNLLPNEEQLLVVDSVAGVLERQLPFQRRFGGQPSTIDVGSLLAEAAESGWLKLGIAPDAGGVGYSPVEEMLLGRELGRNLAPLSICATALAAHLAAAAGETALAADFAEGRQRAGFAVRLNGGAGRYLLLDVDHTQYALLVGAGLGLVPTENLELRPAACIDVTITAAEATIVEADLTTADAALFLRAQLMIAAQLTGLAERARDLGVDYAKNREQFGRPIGAFQAIKHRCSEMATRCEAAYAQASAAAAALSEGADDAAVHVAAAYVVADEAAIENSRAAVQIHGGIGVTDEHALHLLVKRRHVLAQIGAGRDTDSVLLGG